MFKWLLLVGTDGKPDAYEKTTNIDYPSVFLGIIIGVILAALIAFVIIIVHNSKDSNSLQNESNDIDNTNTKSDNT